MPVALVGGVFDVVEATLLEGRRLLTTGCLVFDGSVVKCIFGSVVLCISISGEVFCIVE